MTAKKQALPSIRQEREKQLHTLQKNMHFFVFESFGRYETNIF